MIETDANLPLDDEWAEKTCLLGKGAACCRYLSMGPTGWLCAKFSPGLKSVIDRRVAEGRMGAQGDNCTGRNGKCN